jgi:hypothetical protein
MTRSTNHIRGRNLDQNRARGQKVSQQRRIDFDDMDDSDTWSSALALSGVATVNQELGTDDLEGDSLLEEEGPPGDTEAEEGSPRRAASAVDLRAVIGSRSPVILIRLIREGEQVKAELMPSQRRAEHESLEELRLFVESRFAAGPVCLGEDWPRLLDSRASVTERLQWLTRLAIRGSDVVEVPRQLHFAPNDRGLERYSGKFAVLPDGMPFSLRLLLEDGQGKSKADPTAAVAGFNRLPYAIQLQALRAALADEARTGKAESDKKFAARLLGALTKMGIRLDLRETLLVKHVTDLRRKLEYHGLGHLFLNRLQRQRCYDAETAP